MGAGLLALALLFHAAPWPAALAQSVTLDVLVHGNASYLERTRAFFDGFERHHPGIKINIIPDSGDRPEERLAVMVSAGVSPDLVRLWGVPEVAKAGLIQDLTQRFETLPSSVREDFWPLLINGTLSWDGKLYALPLGTAVSTFFYNKNLFNEAGVPAPSPEWSWEVEGTRELQRLTRDRDGDGSPEVYGLVRIDGGSGREIFPFFYAAGGGPLFSADGTRFLGNSDAVRDALQFVYDLARVHQVMPASGSSWTNFGQQSAAAMLWGSFMFGYMQDFPDLEWDIAHTPTFRGGRATNIWPETPYAIPVGAKHPDEAWKVLEFIASVEGQTLAMELGWGIPPARRSVALSAFMDAFADVNIPAMIDMINEPLTQVVPEHIPADIRTFFYQNVIQAVYAGTAGPAQALEAAAPVIQSMLDEWNAQGGPAR